ncbi:hypothetical protein lbkm_1581 [Lachnospiraceae bacterium KM106-2]|nr:hypothetical protein lbkm_1581 [Lachnospiraceae bacterium KM106-2]
MEKIMLKQLLKEDITTLTPIMKEAFDRDYQLHFHKGAGGPEGYDDGSFLRRWALNKNATSYTVRVKDVIIGAVILWINERTKENMLGCIFLDVSYQDGGYGKQVWDKIEQTYPDTLMWRTETPGFSRRNHYFYVMKCGFHIVRIENPKDIVEANYIFEKKMR